MGAAAILIAGCSGAEAPAPNARASPSASASATPWQFKTGHWTGEPYEIAFTSRRDDYWSIYALDEEGDLDHIVDITSVGNGPPRGFLDFLGHPAWSPDATRMAFTCTHTGRSEVCLVDPATAEVRLLTGAPGEVDVDPDWSADGNLIYFSSFRNGDYDIYSMWPDGSHVRPVVGGPANQSGLDVSPDGRLMAYVQRPERQEVVKVVRLRGTRTRLVESLDDAVMPAWSPSGRELAFSRTRGERFSDLFVYSLKNGAVTRLTRSPGLDSSPAFSPDGTTVAFIRDRLWDGQGYAVSDLFLVDVATGEVTQLTNDSSTDMQPAWKPRPSA